LLIGSHLDTVPHAGAFDGILGVVLATALIEALESRRLNCGIEVIGFSEEEGVRFGVPFIGSRAVTGFLDDSLLARRDARGISVTEAIAAFGLDPMRLRAADAGDDVIGFFEIHIEQGPVLDRLDLPLGVVESIAGQSRLEVRFEGETNHAGTTPMNFRRDALAGAAEWIASVEREALGTQGLVATVGRVDAQPGAGNVIPGVATASLDARHAQDEIRLGAVRDLLGIAKEIAARRGLAFSYIEQLDQSATPMSPRLTKILEDAVTAMEFPLHRMVSGAGHDAMIMARRYETTMLFLRSPGGLSHCPEESVRAEDVAAALAVGLEFLNACDRECEAAHV